jgi:hypothetical protein
MTEEDRLRNKLGCGFVTARVTAGITGGVETGIPQKL